MDTSLSAIRADITKVIVDAIVNAANSSLMGGGGVDGAIHRAGGPAILADCKEIVARQGPCKPGDAVITTAGNLPANFVIHTVGPIYHGGRKNEPTLLASCYRKSLDFALAKGCSSIAFPGISTGIYGYPKKEAAEIAVKTTREWVALRENTIFGSAVEDQDASGDSINQVIFVCFDDESLAIYQSLLNGS